MFNYFRNDYRSVYNAVKLWTNDKAPNWVIVIWYLIMLPVGLVLLPFGKLFQYIVIRKVMKSIEEIDAE